MKPYGNAHDHVEALIIRLESTIEHHRNDIGKIDCRDIYRVADEVCVDLGVVIDRIRKMGIEIDNCQLGLFGRTTKLTAEVSPQLITIFKRELNGTDPVTCATLRGVAQKHDANNLEAGAVSKKLGIPVYNCLHEVL